MFLKFVARSAAGEVTCCRNYYSQVCVRGLLRLQDQTSDVVGGGNCDSVSVTIHSSDEGGARH